MRECRMTPIGANVFGIHLNSWNTDEVKGFITRGCIKEPIPFTSISKMILLLEEQMDIGDCEIPGKKAGQSASPTFELEILFRQNYSWQGKVRWPAGGKEASFRSVLELITILELILEQ